MPAHHRRRDLAPALVASQKLLLFIVALSALAGLVIFGALALLVRRADGLIRGQHAELIEARAHLEERNRRLEEANRRKDLLYAACSHDLRSPLVSAHAGTRLVLTDPMASLSPLHRELLHESSRSVEAVLELIANLLDIARIEAKLTKREVLRRDEYTCQYCGNHNTHLTIDHVLPRRLGGQPERNNLVAACPACNHRKGGRTIEQVPDALVALPI